MTHQPSLFGAHHGPPEAPSPESSPAEVRKAAQAEGATAAGVVRLDVQSSPPLQGSIPEPASKAAQVPRGTTKPEQGAPSDSRGRDPVLTAPHLATVRLPEGVRAEADFYDVVKRSDGEAADRLSLRWTWAGGTQPGAFVCIGINPSGASATAADSTLIRVYGFARREDFGSLLMLNLFSARATEPAELLTYPGRPRYERHVAFLARQEHEAGSVVVAAWGARPAGKLGTLWRDRVEALRSELGDVPLWCLGVGRDGDPLHPLYRPKDTPLVRWG